MTYGNYAPFYRGGYFNPIQPVPDMTSQFNAPIPNIQPASDMIWVLNENEATSYPVAPNNSVVLWDKSTPTIYVKAVNSQGIPSMRILDFTERTANAPQNATEHVCKCGENFVTKEQFTTLQAKFDDMAAIVNEFKAKPVKKSTKEDE